VRRPFVVSVADLIGRPGAQRELEVEAELPDLGVSAAAVPPGEPVRAALLIESTGLVLVASGEVRARFVGECRRCLRAIEGEAVAEVKEVFERDSTEGETYRLDGDHIDLEPLVRDAVLLALPIAPLCEETCGGPAPDSYRVAPADQPADEAPIDPRWAALSELRTDEREN
jgi:uncharacterized protein